MGLAPFSASCPEHDWSVTAGTNRELDALIEEHDQLHRAAQPDMVNAPPHYTSHPKGIECVDVVEENPFPNLAEAMRYLWRVSWGGKWDNGEDLDKAVWFIQREKQRRQAREAAGNPVTS